MFVTFHHKCCLQCSLPQQAVFDFVPTCALVRLPIVSSVYLSRFQPLASVMNCLPDSSSDLLALTADLLGSSYQDIIAKLGSLPP